MTIRGIFRFGHRHVDPFVLAMVAFFAQAELAAAQKPETFVEPSRGTKSEFVYTGTGRGLLVWFHADGGALAYASSLEELKSLAKTYDLSVLVPQAPRKGLWHADGWRNGAYAHALIQDVIRKKSLDRNRVVLAGASGGAVFVAGQFLPLFGKEYGGGALLLCGGAPSLMRAGEMTLLHGDAAFAKRFPIVFVIGTKDYILEQAMRGADEYRTLGHPVTVKERQGASHCAFDRGAALKEGLEIIFKK